MANAVNWFEIPAADFGRAVAFYSKVLNCDMQSFEQAMPDGTKMSFFPHDQATSVGGAIAYGPMWKPSADGSVVYLNGGDDLGVPLSKVEAAGGKVLMPKTKVSDEVGYIGMFIDSEGNRVAFHSRG